MLHILPPLTHTLSSNFHTPSAPSPLPLPCLRCHSATACSPLPPTHPLPPFLPSCPLTGVVLCTHVLTPPPALSQVSFRNRVLILFDWIKAKVFGRDLSLF